MSIKQLAGIAVLGFTVMQSAQAVEQENWLSAGIVSSSSGSVNLLEYETLVSDDTSIGIRMVTGTYTYTDGTYSEDGDISGFEGTLRYYPGAVGFRGLYYGAGIGFWSEKYTWHDSPYYIPNTGTGSKSLFNMNASMGWKIRFARGAFFLDPQLFVGLSTESGFYAGGGLQIGIRF